MCISCWRACAQAAPHHYAYNYSCYDPGNAFHIPETSHLKCPSASLYNNDPSNPPPGAPPAGTYNLVTTTSDCNGHQSASYSTVPGQSGVSYVSNNNCVG